MRKLFLLFVTVVIVFTKPIISQNITLRFTGMTNTGRYVRLDSVHVQNVTQSWGESVVYPDTVLSLSRSGIYDARYGAAEVISYPNPFNGHTTIAVSLPDDGDVTMQVFLLSGQKVMEYSFHLEAGRRLFELKLQKPQVYLLAVTTSYGCTTVKLMNSSTALTNAIYCAGILPLVEKRQSVNPFQSGDILAITGYSTHNGYAVSSRVIWQQQTTNEDFELVFTDSTGTLKGVFSVSSGNCVYFSQGNLQYNNTGTHTIAGGTSATGTWRFAEYQWDVIGLPNLDLSSSYTGWIDLFGWGTSGWNSGANAYYPYSASTSNSDYLPGASPQNSLVGQYKNADWGVYNAISNGGDVPELWRTLTKLEWDYLLNTRITVSGVRYAKAIVNGVKGIIVVPDNWKTTDYALDSTNVATAAYTNNVITLTSWNVLLKTGCVFLPAAGYRYGDYALAEDIGYYWSSTLASGTYAYGLFLHINTVNTNYVGQRAYGYSVRLVRDTTTTIQ